MCCTPPRHDYKVIFVGDASMSSYEIASPGGSVEHFNEEAGSVWMQRVFSTYPSCVWLNPVAEREWDFTELIRMMRQLIGGRMFPLTLEGLDGAMQRAGAIAVNETSSREFAFDRLRHWPRI